MFVSDKLAPAQVAAIYRIGRGSPRFVDLESPARNKHALALDAERL
jgi:hypothetical protein